MQKLIDLLKDVKYSLVGQGNDKPVSGLTADSRKAKAGFLFAAIPGSEADGHDFIPQAIELGALHILLEKMPENPDSKVNYIQVKNASEALALISSAFYDYPSQKLIMTGVTGTNGKTTIVTILYKLFSMAGFKSGLISTIRIMILDKVVNATHTTPDCIRLNEILREMVDAGCTHCFMEVSSHSLVQHRVSGIKFQAGIFTNLTKDHLDYHKTFKNYIDVKKSFFDDLKKGSFAIINSDDKHHKYLVQNTNAEVSSYGLMNPSDFKAKILESSITGLHLSFNGKDFFSDKAGMFNAYNLLAVYATAVKLGIDKDNALSMLSSSIPVDGRFEIFVNKEKNITGIIDYAHTPDALENVLKTIKKCKKKEQRIITVFGCGGNRYKGKRPTMGKIAATYSDFVFITSDNPRFEEPISIIQDILKGINESSMLKVITITDRELAIRGAFSFSQPNDIILVAGKGHETYQDIKGVKSDFDDRKIVKKYLTAL